MTLWDDLRKQLYQWLGVDGSQQASGGRAWDEIALPALAAVNKDASKSPRMLAIPGAPRLL